MTQYNNVNVKLSNLQLDKIKLSEKYGEKLTLWLLSDVISNAIDENNFPHKLLLTGRQVLKLYKAFEFNSSAK